MFGNDLNEIYVFSYFMKINMYGRIILLYYWKGIEIYIYILQYIEIYINIF